MTEDSTKGLSKVIRIDESEIRGHLDEMVRGTVEETLNSLLDAEADELCNAQRYERSPDRIDTRAGHYTRKLHTKAGEVEVRMPKLRKQTFETAIIERYRRRDISIEEAIVQMYLAGVSVRRVEDITEALWGTRVSSGTVSKLNQKVYKHIETWRTQPIEGRYAYVYLDGIVLKRSWGGEVKNVSVLAAIGVDQDGYRCILGVVEGHKEDKSGWLGFLKQLKARGLSGIRLVVSDACLGLVESLAEVFPDADWQRCVVGLLKNPDQSSTNVAHPGITILAFGRAAKLRNRGLAVARRLMQGRGTRRCCLSQSVLAATASATIGPASATLSLAAADVCAADFANPAAGAP